MIKNCILLYFFLSGCMAFAQEFPQSWEGKWEGSIEVWTNNKLANSFILDDTPDEYRPLVQVIDNLERNHKMGSIAEFKVGKGSLLVCSARLNELLGDRPEAMQLYRSIIGYMESEAFKTEFELPEGLF